MTNVTVVVDGKTVATAYSPTSAALPDIVAETTSQWEQSPSYVWEREEKINDAHGQLSEVRIIYRSRTQTPADA